LNSHYQHITYILKKSKLRYFANFYKWRKLGSQSAGLEFVSRITISWDWKEPENACNCHRLL